MVSAISPLQITALQGMLANDALRPSPQMVSLVGSFNALPVITNWLNAYNTVKNSALSAAVKAGMENLTSDSVPAVSNAIPQYYINLGTFNTLAGYAYPYPGFSGIIATKLNAYMGSPGGIWFKYDMSRFCQIFAACQSYADTANAFIESTCNADNYLCETFSNNDNMITGDITKANLATGAFGEDLANLGALINLQDLENFGSPLALIKQIVSITGNIPIVALTFVAEGVPDGVVVALDDPDLEVTDSQQKLMYTAMTKITGTNLQQILNICGVKTTGINTMADLLNPVKLFPKSFQSLTTVTNNGTRAIYTNASGDVNTKLLGELPAYVLSSTV